MCQNKGNLTFVNFMSLLSGWEMTIFSLLCVSSIFFLRKKVTFSTPIMHAKCNISWYFMNMTLSFWILMRELQYFVLLTLVAVFQFPKKTKFNFAINLKKLNQNWSSIFDNNTDYKVLEVFRRPTFAWGAKSLTSARSLVFDGLWGCLRFGLRRYCCSFGGPSLATMLWASVVDSAATSSVHIRSPCCTTVSCLFRNFRQHFLKRGYFAILDSNHIII